MFSMGKGGANHLCSYASSNRPNRFTDVSNYCGYYRIELCYTSLHTKVFLHNRLLEMFAAEAEANQKDVINHLKASFSDQLLV